MYSDADIQGLIERIESPDEAISGAAWQSAGPYGAAAVPPLAALMADVDFELARKAKRALYRVVRHEGEPAAARERRAVERELIRALGSSPSRFAVKWFGCSQRLAVAVRLGQWRRCWPTRKSAKMCVVRSPVIRLRAL